MGMQLGERRGILAEMNVVPLIDILLVLLIIFMVITPTTPFGLQAIIPQEPHTPPGVQPPVPSDVVVVQVFPDGRLKINQSDTTWEDLAPQLETIFKGRAEKVAFVKGDDTVPFAEVARAIGIMRASDIEKVGLITAKLEAGQ